MDLKHMVFESPEDLVAARRERNKRKDMLRKEVFASYESKHQVTPVITCFSLRKKPQRTINIIRELLSILKQLFVVVLSVVNKSPIVWISKK